jgi:hypothetical protein
MSSKRSQLVCEPKKKYYLVEFVVENIGFPKTYICNRNGKFKFFFRVSMILLDRLRIV